MPDVVVNINGNPTGGQNQSPNNQRQTAPPRQGVVQPQQPPVNPQPSNYGGGSGSAPQQPNNGGSAAPNTSNVRTTNNSELNIDMGNLDISGIDTTELRNELESIKKESANQFYSKLYRYIKVGGYRNVRNRYN